MYIYIYTIMYIYNYRYVCICIHVYTYIYIISISHSLYMYIPISLSLSIYIYIYIYWSPVEVRATVRAWCLVTGVIHDTALLSGVRKEGHMTTGRNGETQELLTNRAHALSSYALICAAPMLVLSTHGRIRWPILSVTTYLMATRLSHLGWCEHPTDV